MQIIPQLSCFMACGELIYNHLHGVKNDSRVVNRAERVALS